MTLYHHYCLLYSSVICSNFSYDLNLQNHNQNYSALYKQQLTCILLYIKYWIVSNTVKYQLLVESRGTLYWTATICLKTQVLFHTFFCRILIGVPYTGWTKKTRPFLKCVTRVYDDIERGAVYQNVQLFIRSKTGILNVATFGHIQNTSRFFGSSCIIVIFVLY